MVSIAPEDAEGYFNLGNTLKDLDRFQEARQHYRAATLLKPDFAEALCNFGLMLQQLAQFEAAKKKLPKCYSY